MDGTDLYDKKEAMPGQAGRRRALHRDVAKCPMRISCDPQPDAPFQQTTPSCTTVLQGPLGGLWPFLFQPWLQPWLQPFSITNSCSMHPLTASSPTHPPTHHPLIHQRVQHCLCEDAVVSRFPRSLHPSILAQHCQSTQSLAVCCCTVDVVGYPARQRRGARGEGRGARARARMLWVTSIGHQTSTRL